MEVIRCPAPSIIGVGTPESFFRALRSKDLESGFVNRLVVLPFEGHKKPSEKMRTVPAEPPQELIDRLHSLPKVHFADKAVDGKLPAPLILPWADDGAADVYFEFSP
jgi:hypothetical protein